MPRPGGFYFGWVIFFDLVADEGYGGQIWKSFLGQIRQRRFSGLEGGVICGGGGLVGGGFLLWLVALMIWWRQRF